MNLEQVLQDAVFDGVIESRCTRCGEYIETEPDAETAYCWGCDEVVRVNNILVENGLI